MYSERMCGFIGTGQGQPQENFGGHVKQVPIKLLLFLNRQKGIMERDPYQA